MVIGGIIVAAIFIAILVYLILHTPIFTVKEQQAVIIERFGKFNRVLGPGWNFMWPFIEEKRKFKETTGEVDFVDQRERTVDLPAQTVITFDKVQLEVDSIAYYQISNPERAIYGVDNVIVAVNQLIRTVLRDVIGNTTLEQLLSGRENINKKLQHEVSNASGDWGISIRRVELQAVTPPPSYAEAMRKVSEAELSKKAAITAAEGKREAARLEAQGEAERISLVYDAIHKGRPTEDLLKIKYLEALAKIADGQATKVFMPFPMTSVTGSGSGDFFQQGLSLAAGIDAYNNQQGGNSSKPPTAVEEKTELIAPVAAEPEEKPFTQRGYKLTSQALLELRKAGITPDVLTELKRIEGQPMLRQRFESEIARIVGSNKHPYYDVIMKHSQEIQVKKQA
ncbi:SPFH domain, Band 7 family protein [Candidatus Moduliflexus flocculans]|uniref:SPFH domain, Band 7 family protein n=1 Tax=Candidatus Moduliflexus flocculans TaxID=1499966 RepID=A0A081BST9_9BACT|nr:SPFH domain, Band 7 family protein [Candidatus Moduliflexus flocculans]